MCDVIGGNGKLQRLAGALNGDPELLRTFLARPPSLPGTRMVWLTGQHLFDGSRFGTVAG